MSVSATFLFDSVFWLYGDMANVNFFSLLKILVRCFSVLLCTV
jgi:hypothetical protein